MVDVGGTTLKGALADRNGALFLRDRRQTSPDKGAQAVLEAILRLIELESFRLCAALGELCVTSPAPPRAGRS